MAETETTLVHRARSGDRDAFAALVDRHGVYVYNLALRLVGQPQEAEDLAQEAFVRAWRALPGFRAEAQFRTWLYRIVTNLCYNRLPRLRADLDSLPPDASAQLPDAAPGVERQLVNAELQDALRAAIAGLPPGYRLLITLRHLQGLSYEEIAVAADMPLGTVKTGIFRARRLLREALAAYGPAVDDP